MDLDVSDMQEANRYLGIMDQGNRDVRYSIRNRAMQCRGVIASWEGKVEEFL